MRKKKALIIVLTVLIFLSAAVLGVSAVYRVNAVTVRSSVVSDEAKTEADALQALLQKAYDKQSIFSADQEAAQAIVEDFPYFRITSFKKAYPNRLIVSVSEDAEVYAVPVTGENTYYILSENGTVLGIREDIKNRSDGADNLLIAGLNVTGEKGEHLKGDIDEGFLFSFLGKISAKLEGIRRNVEKIEVVRLASSAEETVFKLCMREGVNIYIRNPASMAFEKQERAVNAYLSLSSEQKLKGMLMISEVNGEVIDVYNPVDGLEN